MCWASSTSARSTDSRVTYRCASHRSAPLTRKILRDQAALRFLSRDCSYIQPEEIDCGCYFSCLCCISQPPKFVFCFLLPRPTSTRQPQRSHSAVLSLPVCLIRSPAWLSPSLNLFLHLAHFVLPTYRRSRRFLSGSVTSSGSGRRECTRRPCFGW